MAQTYKNFDIYLKFYLQNPMGMSFFILKSLYSSHISHTLTLLPQLVNYAIKNPDLMCLFT